MQKKLWQQQPFHLLFFAVYPILSLYFYNQTQILFVDVIRILLIVIGSVTIGWGMLSYLLHNRLKAAFFVSLFVFIFFSFRNLLSGIAIAGNAVGKAAEIRRLLETRTAMIIWLCFWVVLYALVVHWFNTRKPEVGKITSLLNSISLVLVCTVLITPLQYLLANSNTDSRPKGTLEQEWTERIKADPCLESGKRTLPDIYYIVVDGYARDDVLKDIYQLDNLTFISFLEKNGFYVARDARTNYKQTNLSIASSLNMVYLDEIASEIGVNSIDETPLYSVISNSQVIHQLHCLGYTVVAFESGDWFTEIDTADLTYSPGEKPNSFESMILDSTPISILMIGKQYDWHRDRILYTLDTLPDTATIAGPKFIFAHIMSPHPPFILGPNGEEIHPNRMFSATDGNFFMAVADQQEYVAGYRDQVTYLNIKLEQTIQGILEQSEVDPIIIIQGDHGPASQLDAYSLEGTNITERMTILNAYHLPKMESTTLYDGITPVNSFRIIFNEFLGANYPLLPDRSYYSLFTTPFNFIDVTDQIEPGPFRSNE